MLERAEDVKNSKGEYITRNPNEFCDIWSCGATCLLMDALVPINTDFAKQVKENGSRIWMQILGWPVKKISAEKLDFYEKLFKIEYRSERNARTGKFPNDGISACKDGECRPTGAEMLQSDAWLNGEVATDAEFAEFIVCCNQEKLGEGLLSCPKDYRLLSRKGSSSGGGGGGGGRGGRGGRGGGGGRGGRGGNGSNKEINTFFGVLVGTYYKNTYQAPEMQPAHKFLQTMGFSALAAAFEESNETIQDMALKHPSELIAVAELNNIPHGEHEICFIACGLNSMGVENLSSIEWVMNASGV